MPYVKKRYMMCVTCGSSVADVCPWETSGFLLLNIYATFTPQTKLSTGSTDFFLHTNLYTINVLTKAASYSLFWKMLIINITNQQSLLIIILNFWNRLSPPLKSRLKFHRLVMTILLMILVCITLHHLFTFS